MENEDRKRSMEEEDEERRKQASRRVPFNVLDQVHSDFALATALQEQQGAFTTHTTIESESQDDEEESGEASSDEDYDNDYEFFSEGHDLEAGDLDFLEGQDSNSDQDMEEEDEIDPDELSYEELIALGEFIGEEQRGLTLSEIATCLHPRKYRSSGSKTETETDRCVICQVEYEEGESLAALACGHPYHSECISNWLQVKKTCPICSTEVSSSNRVS